MIERDTGNLQKFVSQLSKRVLIGIPAEKTGRDEGINNAQLGYINEKGSPAQNIPARPFLEPAINSGREAAVAEIKKGVMSGDIEGGLSRAGISIENIAKNNIISQNGFEGLSAKTLSARAKKGFKGTKALIESGQLLRSITSVVKNG